MKKGEHAIAEYVEAERALRAILAQQDIAADVPDFEHAVTRARARVKAAYAKLTGGQLGDARRRLLHA